MYKVDKNIIPSYIRDIFPDKRGNASSYTTRNSQNYSLPKCRLQLYKTSFVPTVIGEWNTLPQEIRDAPSHKSFSQKIISHFAEDVVKMESSNLLSCHSIFCACRHRSYQTLIGHSHTFY